MRKKKKIKYYLFGSGWSIFCRLCDINGIFLVRLVMVTIVVGLINKINFVNPKTEILVGFAYIFLISLTILVIAEGATNNFFTAYTREKYFGGFIRDWYKKGYGYAKALYDEGMSWARLMNNNPDLEYELDEIALQYRMGSIKTVEAHRQQHALFVEYGVYNKKLKHYCVLWCQKNDWKQNRAYNKSIARKKALQAYPDDHAYDRQDEQMAKINQTIYEMYGQEGYEAMALTGKELQKKEAELNAKRRRSEW